MPTLISLDWYFSNSNSSLTCSHLVHGIRNMIKGACSLDPKTTKSINNESNFHPITQSLILGTCIKLHLLWDLIYDFIFYYCYLWTNPRWFYAIEILVIHFYKLSNVSVSLCVFIHFFSNIICTLANSCTWRTMGKCCRNFIKMKLSMLVTDS